MDKKVVLRDALRGWLPDELLDRPKWGFGVPLADWFRGDLRDWAQEILLDRETLDRGYFRPEYVRSTLETHLAGREDASPRIWALIVLELWHREVLDGDPGSAPLIGAQSAGR
jgi:asparagine synthase (glutamine-hydrolysing)